MALNRERRNIIILLTSVFILYGNTLRNGFVLDDDVVFLKNKFVQSGLSGIPDIISHGFLYGFNQKNDQSYRPVVLIVFASVREFFGNNPVVLHLLNILLYSILILCLYKLLSLLFPNSLQDLIFWICLLYLSHPVHTEVVANIKGLDDILHGTFYLSSLYFLVKFFDHSAQKYAFLSAVLLLFAALSKEMAITALLLFPLSIYVFRKQNILAILKQSWPVFLALAVYFILRISILDVATFEEKMTPINNAIAAGNNMSERMGTTIAIMAYYFRLLLFPSPLSWDYSIPFFDVHRLTEGPILLFSLLLLASIAWSIYLVFNKRNPIAYAWLFFLITFSVVSNVFILIGSTLGERFLFLPSIGFSMITVFFLSSLWEQIKQRKKYIYFFFIPILLLYSFKTIDRNSEWESNETLFFSALEIKPQSARVLSAVGSIYRQRAEESRIQQEKLHAFQNAIEYYNKSLSAHEPVADVWYNLGVSYMGMNNAEPAKNAFRRTLEIDPNFMDAMNNLGVLFFNEQNYQEASLQFSNCLKINPNYASAHANLGAIYHNLGQYEKARTYYNQALRLNPQDINTANNLRKLPSQ